MVRPYVYFLRALGAVCALFTWTILAAAQNPGQKANLYEGGLYDSCNGIVIGYMLKPLVDIPSVQTGSKEPWGFRATLSVANLGSRDLKDGWSVLVNYTHNELITSVNQVQVDPELPARGKGLVFTALPGINDNVITAVNSGGEVVMYVMNGTIDGTEFGAHDPVAALPKTMSLINPGYKCQTGKPHVVASQLQVCCKQTFYPPPPPPLPPQKRNTTGDIEITIDVTQSNVEDYWALVTINNTQRYRRVDAPGWALTWSWGQGEIVWEVKGAQVSDAGQCLDAKAAKSYSSALLQDAHSCDSTPTFVDALSSDYMMESAPDSLDHTKLSCCKNGTLGLATFPNGKDPKFKDVLGNSSFAQFRMRVGKTLAQNGYRKLTPPHNIDIGLPGYTCGAAVSITPSNFTLKKLPKRTKPAYKTWLIQCFQDPAKMPPPKCCVSFSAFFNKTRVGTHAQNGVPLLAPCKSCACGCNFTSIYGNHTKKPSCIVQELQSPRPTPNMMLAMGSLFAANTSHPSLRPPSNISLEEPDEHPVSPRCGDGCGVNVHWHVRDSYELGWVAKLTIVNRGLTVIKDWFAGIEMEGLENTTRIYSFNHENYTSNSTLLWGFDYGNNWLLGTKKKAKRLSNVQTIIQLGITKLFNLTESRGADAFPTKIYFNGDECAMPEFIPTYIEKPEKHHDISTKVIAIVGAVIICAGLAYLLVVSGS